MISLLLLVSMYQKTQKSLIVDPNAQSSLMSQYMLVHHWHTYKKEHFVPVYSGMVSEQNSVLAVSHVLF